MSMGLLEALVKSLAARGGQMAQGAVNASPGGQVRSVAGGAEAGLEAILSKLQGLNQGASSGGVGKMFGGFPGQPPFGRMGNQWGIPQGNPIGPMTEGLGNLFGNIPGALGGLPTGVKVGMGGLGALGVGAGAMGIGRQMSQGGSNAPGFFGTGGPPTTGPGVAASPSMNPGGANQQNSQQPGKAPQPYGTGARVGANSQGNLADLKNPQEAIFRSLYRQGLNPAALRSDPRFQRMIKNMDGLMLPVYDAIRADPSNYDRVDQLIDEQVSKAMSGGNAFYSGGAGTEAYQGLVDAVQPYATGGQTADPMNKGLQFLLDTMQDPNTSQSLFSNMVYGGVGPGQAGVANNALTLALNQLRQDMEYAGPGEGPQAGSYLNLIELLKRGMPNNFQRPTSQNPGRLGGV